MPKAEFCLIRISLSNATSICDYAFYGCQKLKTVLVNQSCHIGKSILFRCENVFNMNISGKYKLSSYFGGLCSRVNDLTVNGDIVDDFCRGNKTLKTLTLNNVAKFGRWSFYGNTSLCNIVINSVAEIGDWAFAYCDGITNIVLPKSIEYIGMNAFRYCHNLQSITIMSESAIHFGANAFYSTSDRKMFYVSKDIAYLYANLSEWREYLNYIVSI